MRVLQGRGEGIRKIAVWPLALSLVLVLLVSGPAGAVEQYDDPDEGLDEGEITTSLPEETEISPPEEQYEGEEGGLPEEEFIPEPPVEEDPPAPEETTEGTTGEEPESTAPEATSGVTPSGGSGGTSGGGTSGGGGSTGGTGGNVDPTEVPPPPPDPNEPPPQPGDKIPITIVNTTTVVTIVNIDHGIIVCSLPGGELYEIPLHDLDGDGWISLFECYICICGWLGYRHYDYSPNQVYNYIQNTYNVNISNNYQQTGAIRPTPTERVAGLLPDTGGPALLAGGVVLLVVGAIFVGRYTKRS
ncbi:Hypothetical Protein RradSPS_0806 [Rubrobacter radiotolerans]|uniref:Gram-positive cocci surface proteins LPxTG domain-containing protein n=1 Tax=Rubrobacter radiotolerans TaxID=42256 RepID=A0A023X226_RUBRA|nr:hypothetical protein [Rubrobacter radiotolerans]AHY46089.1 Hypothetical Protein RradSPS_0806 [Rubrobacter radiotolerans]SMC03857.1 LPXTG-motif cell wall anchor domain protein [Rubrobacter radiotolerans DSM 5868]